MNPAEAADYLRISTKTLGRITKLGKHQKRPRDPDRTPLDRELSVGRIGRNLVYRKADLDRYLEVKVLSN